MLFSELAEHFRRIEEETKRLELVRLVLELLKATPKDHVDKVLYLLQGRIRPEFEGVELGLAEKLTIRTVEKTFGVPATDVVAARNEEGDLGRAVEGLLQRRSQKSLFEEPLSVARVYDGFVRIAESKGAGSQESKLRQMSELLHAAKPLEARYLVRLVGGKLRLGVAEQTMVEALALWVAKREASSVQDLDDQERAERAEAKRLVERGLNVSSDVALVAKTLMQGGLDAVADLRIRVGVPIRPMLSERTETLAKALELVGGRARVEFKYDGLRMQVHVGDRVRVFSRRLEELTPQFPDVVEAAAKAFAGHQVIVEGEAVAVDPQTGAILPFQVLSTRRGRKSGISSSAGQSTLAAGVSDYTKKVPVKLFLFDALFVDGDEVVDSTLEDRRAALERVVTPAGAVELGESLVVDSVAALEEYFQRVTNLGAEGVMIKNPSSAYQAGNRGWAWIKFKHDYVEGLQDSLDLVAVGAYWGQGRRGGWYGALLMAAFNDESGTFESVCRLATGFDDQTLRGLQDRLAPFATSTKPANVEAGEEPDVWLQPGLVLEVVGAELTLSPRHKCAWGSLESGAGLSVRFPRFTGRWRSDRAPEQATTTQELVGMYQRRHSQSAAAE